MILRPLPDGVQLITPLYALIYRVHFVIPHRPLLLLHHRRILLIHNAVVTVRVNDRYSNES